MKKRIIITAALAVLMIVVASLFAFSAAAADTVIYISDAGTGDGSSPDKPLGNDAAYTAALTSGTADYKLSAFWKGWDAVKGGGTIVIVGDTTVKYTTSATGTDFYLPAMTKGAKVTVTSVYGGTDYRTSGARLILDSCSSGTRIHHQDASSNGIGVGTIVYEKLNILRQWTSTKAQAFYLAFAGNDTTLGEELVITQYDVATQKETTSASIYPVLIGGKMWTATNDNNGDGIAVKVTIKSGKYYYYASQQFPSQSTGNINGDVVLDFSNCEFTHTAAYSSTGAGICTTSYTSPLENAGQVIGDVSLTLTGVKVKKFYGTTSYLGSGAKAGFGNVKGDVTITLNPGTKVYDTMSYLTPNYWASDASQRIAYGQIGGNATVIVNGTDANNPVSVYRIDLGAFGFSNSNSVFTYKFNGTNWTSTNTSALSYMGSGSNFLSASGYRGNAVLDFSGMTYAEYWAHNINSATALNASYFTNKKIMPAFGETQYGKGPSTTGSYHSYGFSKIIEPSDPHVSVVVETQPTKVSYNAGEAFDAAGMAVKLTYTSGNSVTLTEGFTFSDDALAPTVTSVTVSGKGAYGEAWSVDIPITVKDTAYINDLRLVYDDTVALGQVFDPATDVTVYPIWSDNRTVTEPLAAGSYTVEGVDASSYLTEDGKFAPSYQSSYLQTLLSVTFKVTCGNIDKTFSVKPVSDVEVNADKIIYVSDNGTGDGKSVTSPLGFYKDYPSSFVANATTKYLDDGNGNQLPANIYYMSPLWRAIYALRETGGTIKIVDDASFGIGGNSVSHNYISAPGTGNIYMPSWSKTITITSDSGEGNLHYNLIYNNPRWHFNGPVDIKNVDLVVDYSSTTNTTSYRPAIAFGGFTSSIQVNKNEYVLYDGSTGTPTASASKVPVLCGAHMWNATKQVNLTVTGGTWYQIFVAGNVGLANGVTIGESFLTLNNVTTVSNVYAASNRSTNSTTGAVTYYAKFSGDVTITINGGHLGAYVMFCSERFTSDDCTFTIKVNDLDSFKNATTFWASAGSSVYNKQGTRVIDFSGMSKAKFDKVGLAKTFYTQNADALANGYGVSSSTGGRFDTVIFPTDISYSGTSIRLTGNEGLRFEVGLAQSSLANIKEMGILVGNAKQFGHVAPLSELTLADVRSAENASGMALKVALVDTASGVNKYFRKDDSKYYYTAVLVNSDTGLTGSYVTNNFVFREYAITKNGTVIYGDYVGLTDDANKAIVHSDLATVQAGEGLWRSVRYVAQQAIANEAYMATLTEALQERLYTLAGN